MTSIGIALGGITYEKKDYWTCCMLAVDADHLTRICHKPADISSII
jgi:hypothetical protein